MANTKKIVKMSGKKLTETLAMQWPEFNAVISVCSLVILERILREERRKDKSEQRSSYVDRLLGRIGREITIELRK